MWSDDEVLVVSPILKRVVYPWLANSGYLRRRADGGSFCVITYHGVLPEGYQVSDPQQDGSLVTAENFRSQLQLLKECYHVVTPEQVREWIVEGKDLPELAVLLTCDDGLRNALTDMTPILREQDLLPASSLCWALLPQSIRRRCGMRISISHCWQRRREATLSMSWERASL